MEKETEVPVVEIEKPNDTTDYKTLHEESQNKVKELEGLIQKHKTKKPDEKATTGLSEAQVKAMLREEKFYDSNPDMLEHREKIAEFTSKGLTEAQAAKLIVDEDPTIANRKTAQQTNFTAGEKPQMKVSMTQEEVSKLPIEERKQMWDKFNKGEVSIT